ncbi:MAG: hypothetical protein ACYDBW_03980 [Sulfuricaulis sp.]
MRPIPYIVLTIAAMLGAAMPVMAGESIPMQTRPHIMKCQASVRVWVEVDGASLPGREHAFTEARKTVSLRLSGSTPARGESVICQYASRGHDITTSYSERCVDPRKLRGYRHAYSCR